MKHQDLSVLFQERPQKYGYRGDYYFWEYLEKYFREHPEISKRKDIIKTIKQQFKQISSVNLKADAIPLLLERFDEFK